MVFSGPDIINNVGIRVKEETVIIEVQGISERYSRSEAPTDSPALYIYDSLISMENLTPMAVDDVVMVKGSGQSGSFTAILNGTGYVTELKFDKIDTVLKLENHILQK